MLCSLFILNNTGKTSLRGLFVHHLSSQKSIFVPLPTTKDLP
uniref:Uncharacterized protein n=1 Tax=Arundo donax TaxID=35708 RepID=A0A0A9C7R2_ARUDO